MCVCISFYVYFPKFRIVLFLSLLYAFIDQFKSINKSINHSLYLSLFISIYLSIYRRTVSLTIYTYWRIYLNFSLLPSYDSAFPLTFSNNGLVWFFYTKSSLYILTVLYQTIQFISALLSSIWPIDRTRPGPTTPGQSGPGNDSNEGVLCIPQGSSISGASLLDCFV